MEAASAWAPNVVLAATAAVGVPGAPQVSFFKAHLDWVNDILIPLVLEQAAAIASPVHTDTTKI